MIYVFCLLKLANLHMLYPPSALRILYTNLVSEECKENGRVGSDSKDGNAAVENH